MSSSQRSAGSGPARTDLGPLRLGAAVLITLIGLAGCASVQPGASSGAGSGPAVSIPSGLATAPATAAGPTASGGAVNPGGPVTSPQAQAAQVPAGAKLVSFDGVSKSADGMTVYLSAMSAGGACGQYDVVVQETSSTVKLGLAHIPPSKTVPCPMFVRNTEFPAHLASALGNRQVIDLANGQNVGPGGSIPLSGADHPMIPQ
jgi:hypothetical protein